VARAYDTYVLCRSQQLLHVELPKGKSTQHIVVIWTNGLMQLPWPGGVDEQPFTTMLFFERFIAGDRKAAEKRLSK
jgi:hypothetical protein